MNESSPELPKEQNIDPNRKMSAEQRAEIVGAVLAQTALVIEQSEFYFQQTQDMLCEATDPRAVIGALRSFAETLPSLLSEAQKNERFFCGDEIVRLKMLQARFNTLSYAIQQFLHNHEGS